MKRGEPVLCPYSPSCFTCPMKDCVVDLRCYSITMINVLPGDLERARAERSKAAQKRKAATA